MNIRAVSVSDVKFLYKLRLNDREQYIQDIQPLTVNVRLGQHSCR
jgi:hypothetical protein